ncbi:MAG: glycosyltransferase [Theionarchaea archaeon]|nr:glycosyltransferase [Theionarchaea archaeon]MBU7037510.1 glycosyltransferase [Theionarchaea archaeon]
MRVLFICGQKPTYVRNAVILKGLRQQGVDVVECCDLSSHYPVRYLRALFKYFGKKDFDMIFVGFFGQPLVPLIRKMTGKPIIFDAFLSAYDTICFDRKWVPSTSGAGKFCYWLDKTSCQSADAVLLDTQAHIDYFVRTFSLDENKFHRVFVGADDSVFYPREAQSSQFMVFFYGTYRPLQGIEYIVKAAKELELNPDVTFHVVGTGPEHRKIVCLAQKLQCRNIQFIDWVDYDMLPLDIAKAAVCLGGHFSESGKAHRTIAGKTFQFLAMRKPVVVSENPANRELLDDSSAFFVEHASPTGIARAVLTLKENPELRLLLAEKGYDTFREKCTPSVVGTQIRTICETVME